MSYKIEDIEGIGPASADKLAKAAVTTTGHLLSKCSTPAGRKAVAETSGVGESTILKWTNMADLMRISGVGPQFAELLKGTGVDTVKELRNRNAANLAEAMEKVNEEKNLTRVAPPAKTVTKWINVAQTMDPCITY